MIPTNILISVLEPLLGKDELKIHAAEAEKENISLENQIEEGK